MRRLGDRRVDVETDAGPLRFGLWADKWVIAWRRTEGATGEEVFDVFARTAEELVAPLVHHGFAEHAARELAEALVAERAAMDASGEG
jgi:hypothetical protein